jgi:hypothetical protein
VIWLMLNQKSTRLTIYLTYRRQILSNIIDELIDAVMYQCLTAFSSIKKQSR